MSRQSQAMPATRNEAVGSLQMLCGVLAVRVMRFSVIWVVRIVET